MTQQQKINELREWLKTNGIKCFEPLNYNDPDHKGYYDRGVRFVIPVKHIAVVECKPEDEDSVFHDLRKAGAQPFFVRDSETMEFIIGKMQNRLKGWNTAKVKKEQAKAERRAALEAKKAARQQPKPRKRQRVHISAHPVFEKVSSYRNTDR